MKYTLLDFEPEHAKAIFKESGPLPLSEDKMVQAYTLPGSLAATLLADGVPVACGGIMNLEWHRGEAWLLTGRPFRSHVKTTIKVLKRFFPIFAARGCFVRVQATSFNLCNQKLFLLLGFEQEGILRHFGPEGQDAIMFSRIFTWGEPCPP